MKISKSYSRNLNLGNYQSARIGIELEKEINDNPSKEKLKIISNKLLEVRKV